MSDRYGLGDRELRRQHEREFEARAREERLQREIRDVRWVALRPQVLEALKKTLANLEAALRGVGPIHNDLRLAVEIRELIAKWEDK